MAKLLDAAAIWPALLIALVIFGSAPHLVLRLLLLAYPKDHPRRAELWAELPAVPRWERPFWVCEQIDGALFEGLSSRRRGRSPLPQLLRDTEANLGGLLDLGGLLELARRGDRQALETLINRVMPLVWNIARSRGLDRDAAADATQDTFVKLLDHLDILSADQLLTWLICTARRESQAQ